MANQIVPAQVLLAVQELYEDLPELIGEQQWLAAKPAVDEWMARLAESAATLHGLDDSMELVACLSSYPNVREHLRSELSGQQVRAALGDNASSVERATLDFFRYEEGSEETVRRVVLNANGTEPVFQAVARNSKFVRRLKMGLVFVT